MYCAMCSHSLPLTHIFHHLDTLPSFSLTSTRLFYAINYKRTYFLCIFIDDATPRFASRTVKPISRFLFLVPFLSRSDKRLHSFGRGKRSRDVDAKFQSGIRGKSGNDMLPTFVSSRANGEWNVKKGLNYSPRTNESGEDHACAYTEEKADLSLCFNGRIISMTYWRIFKSVNISRTDKLADQVSKSRDRKCAPSL